MSLNLLGPITRGVTNRFLTSEAAGATRAKGGRQVWIVFVSDLSVTNPPCFQETSAGVFEVAALLCLVRNHSEGHLSTPVS
jgi:hypothetical protein